MGQAGFGGSRLPDALSATVARVMGEAQPRSPSHWCDSEHQGPRFLELPSGAARRDRTSADDRRRLNERLRAAFNAGAEEDSRRRMGRGLTREELERVLRRYPGDING